MAAGTVLLDACVLINLLASGEIEDILSYSSDRFKICAAVTKEAIYLRPDDPTSESADRILLDDFIKAGLLEVCDVESDYEEALYVYYAAQLDDGEAASLAVALSRGYVLATDDRKARRLFCKVAEAEGLLCTSEIIRSWAEWRALSPETLADVLRAIGRRARFFPPASDANYRWWNDACS